MTIDSKSNLQFVMDCVTYPSADAKYRALVAADWAAKPIPDLSSAASPDTYSELECRVFGFDAADVPALFWAYERYENLIGSSDAYFGEFAEDERRMYPGFYDEGCWCFSQAVGFVKNVSGLPQPDCMAWVLKVVAAQVRCGLYTYPEDGE